MAAHMIGPAGTTPPTQREAELQAELQVTRTVAEAADRVMNGRAVQSELWAALAAWREYLGEAS